MKRTTSTAALAVFMAGASLFACKDASKPEVATEAKAVTAAPEVEGPTDVVYAASTVLRVVDFAKGEVVASVPLGRAVRQIRFADDGTAYVAASGGMFVFDGHAHQQLANPITTPVRAIDIADDGKTVTALSHQVIVNPDKSREVLPFFLSTYDVASKRVTNKETIGQRIFFAARRAGDNGHDLVLTEDGRVRTISGSEPLSSDGTKVDPLAGQGGADQPFRVRHEAVRHGSRAYLPVEGYPSRVLVVDLKSGATSALMLDRAYPLRGVAVSPDGATVAANVGIGVVLIDAASGEIRHRVETPDPTSQLAFSSDGKYIYTAQVVDGTGGAIHAISVADGQHVKKIHLDDISPWALAVRPR
ncbi:MAG: hypothetical protein RIT81_04705 [Deltaproteobacteria bacterium]